MWNQPCYSNPPNTGGQWVYIPASAGGTQAPAMPDFSGKSLRKTLKKAIADRDALDEAIKQLEEKKKKNKKPEEEKKGLHIIYQSMIMMMTVIPIGVLDFILIRALHQ